MAKNSTVNRQKRNIFTVNRQMNEPKLAVKFSLIFFLNFIQQAKWEPIQATVFHVP